MQGDFLEHEEIVKSLRLSLSEARLGRYLLLANGNFPLAMQLYHWNALLSQSLYLPLQMWEVALRNRMNSFLLWKYGKKTWPYHDGFLRNLSTNDKAKLDKTLQRLARERKAAHPLPVDLVVADLSAGFWVSLLTARYDQHLNWKYNLARIFPYENKISRSEAHAACDGLLDIRNRIAHHEPVYHRKLPDRWSDLKRLLAALCPGASSYAVCNCTFETTYGAKPG